MGWGPAPLAHARRRARLRTSWTASCVYDQSQEESCAARWVSARGLFVDQLVDEHAHRVTTCAPALDRDGPNPIRCGFPAEVLLDAQPAPRKIACGSQRASRAAAKGFQPGETVRASQQQISWAAGVVLPLLMVPARVEAYELSAGVSLGWLQAGIVPRLTVGPHAGISWPIQRDILLTVHDMCMILPSTQADGPGVYNQTSVDLGYAWKGGNFSAGPSVAFYVVPACGSTLCGLFGGLAVGGHAQTNAYVAGPLGVSVSMNVDWVGRGSLVLPGYVSVVVVAGPVLRWSGK
jgi:hypothetical protein